MLRDVEGVTMTILLIEVTMLEEVLIEVPILEEVLIVRTFLLTVRRGVFVLCAKLSEGRKGLQRRGQRWLSTLTKLSLRKP